jgi:hypothetical protein
MVKEFRWHLPTKSSSDEGNRISLTMVNEIFFISVLVNFQSTSRKNFQRNLAAVAAPTITSQKEPKEFCQPSTKHLTLSVLLMLRSLSKHMPCVYAPG